MTGLWSRYRPEDLATPEAFLRDPRMVWDWYAWRRSRLSEVEPNPGHEAIAALERACQSRGAAYLLVTQNVDGLHAAAGSRLMVELHGNIRRVRCFDHGHVASRWDDAVPGPPPCPTCGSALRPDVVWFGEMLPPAALQSAMRAASRCEVFLSVGTSGLVEPAASLPYAALEGGAKVIEVNPDPTPLAARAWAAFAGKAGEVLPRLLPLESCA